MGYYENANRSRAEEEFSIKIILIIVSLVIFALGGLITLFVRKCKAKENRGIVLALPQSLPEVQQGVHPPGAVRYVAAGNPYPPMGAAYPSGPMMMPHPSSAASPTAVTSEKLYPDAAHNPTEPPSYKSATTYKEYHM